MQTIDFLETAKWVIKQFSDEITVNILQGRAFDMLRSTKDLGSSGAILGFVTASQEIAVVAGRLLSHPFAPKVLQAFELEQLLDKDFPKKLAEAAIKFSGSNAPDGYELVHSIINPLSRGWRNLTQCIGPIERLVIPQEVLHQEDFDDVLTIELRYEDQVNPKIETISSVLNNITRLYESISRLYGFSDFTSLKVIYADSGSAFRFDLKGIGEPIKRIKELLVEGWNLIRHRKAEDFRHNNKALLESLETIKKIYASQQSGALEPEDALRIRTLVLDSAIALFEEGVMPREIPRVEVVSNQQLLEGFQQKLLTAASEELTKEDTQNKSQKARSKTKRTKKASPKSNS